MGFWSSLAEGMITGGTEQLVKVAVNAELYDGEHLIDTYLTELGGGQYMLAVTSLRIMLYSSGSSRLLREAVHPYNTVTGIESFGLEAVRLHTTSGYYDLYFSGGVFRRNSAFNEIRVRV